MKLREESKEERVKRERSDYRTGRKKKHMERKN
jgi:hypothetical protein